MPLPRERDAFGHAVHAFLDGQRAQTVIERDDGYVDVDDLARYFAEHRDWPSHQKRALRFAKGRVLDVGCGAGRHALHLQNVGREVMAIDISPGAVEVCRTRGVKRVRLVPVTQIPRTWGPFDTLLLLGNNFGLLENPTRAKWLLRRFHRLTSERGRILAETLDPSRTSKLVHRTYQRRNRARGRPPGQVRLRVRYESWRTPWFDYLFVSKDEMASLVDGTGWRAVRWIDSREAQYVALLEKTPEDCP